MGLGEGYPAADCRGRVDFDGIVLNSAPRNVATIFDNLLCALAGAANELREWGVGQGGVRWGLR